MTTQHNFNTSIEGVELNITGYFDSDGNYEIEDVLHADQDIQELVSEYVLHEIRYRAVSTFRDGMDYDLGR